MKILVVKGESEYDSTGMFLDEMMERLADYGWEVRVLDNTATKKELAEKKAERYDVIFTINAMLLEQGNTLGEELLKNGSPLYCTYLMDHPMIHSERLSNPYKKIFVLCPDRNHAAYIDRYMKNIWGVAFLPHAGCAGRKAKPYRDREREIVFFGSYQAPSEVIRRIQNYPADMQKLMNSLIEKLLDNPERTLEQALEEVVQKAGMNWTEQEFHAVMSEMREIDRYVRVYYRDKVLRTLVDAGLSVDVYGHGWEKFISPEPDNLHIHEAVSFAESLDILGDTKIALNVMPWFKDGSHDRVFSAMLNGAVCLTDTSGWLKETGKEEENIFFYSLKGIRYLPGKVRRILREEELAGKVAENGKRTAEKYHRWANRADEIRDYLESVTASLAGEAVSAYTKEERDFFFQIREKVIEMLRLSYKTLYYLKRREYLYALMQMTQLLESLETGIERILSAKSFYNQEEPVVDEREFAVMMENIMQSVEIKDYILTADFLEMGLIPFLIKLQEIYAAHFPVEIDRKKLEENLQAFLSYAPALAEKLGIRDYEETVGRAEELLRGNYRIEYTSCGMYTLAVDASGTGKEFLYYHSNGAVMEEAMLLADAWFEDGVYDYGIIGAGLGAAVQALLEKDECIEVLEVETDANIILLKLVFGELKTLLESGRYTLVYDKDLTCLTAGRTENRKREWCVHYPAVSNIRDAFLREQIEDYFINKSSMRTQKIRMDANFAKNAEKSYPPADVLQKEWEGKTLYIIAAGPSLDKNMEELKRVGRNGIILATGTVLKKLCRAGIPVDYGIIIDAGAATYLQIEGIASCNIPILCMITAYHKIVSEYRGPKYFICQEGYHAAESYAKEHGCGIYRSGGSVTTTALELGIRFGCKKIVFVGLDLAYSNGKYHATDTAMVQDMQEGNTRLVEDVNGGKVLTGKNLDIYRKWIENRIALEKDGIFIDATEGGAKVKGCLIRELREVISEDEGR